MGSSEKGLAASASPIIGTAVFMLTLSTLLSGFTSGIWLIVLGEWAAIGIGLGAGILMPFAYAFLRLPLRGLTALARRFHEKGRRKGLYVLLFLSALYSNLVVAFWVFSFFEMTVSHILPETAVPLFLWWYAAVMGPLAYLAREESDEGYGFAFALFLAGASCGLLTTSWLLGANLSLALMVVCLSLLAFVFSVVGPLVGLAQQRRRFEEAWQKPAR